MAKKNKTTLQRWLSNRFLVSVEAILLVGLLESLAENYVMAQGWPKPVVTLIIMLMIAGAFGVLMSVMVLLTKRSLLKGQKVVNLLPFSIPHLAIHIGVLSVIFWLYFQYY